MLIFFYISLQKMRLKEKIFLTKAQCAKKSEALVEEAIMNLPKEFQNVVKSCFEAAKNK